MPQAFPSTAQPALIVGRTPGPQPTPPSARRSVDDADFIGEKRVQGDPRGPGGLPHNFRSIADSGKTSGIGLPACPTSRQRFHFYVVHRRRPPPPRPPV